MTMPDIAEMKAELAAVKAEIARLGPDPGTTAAAAPAPPPPADPHIEPALRAGAVRGWFVPAELWAVVAGDRDPRPPPSGWLDTLYRASLVDRADPRRWMLLDRHRLPRLAAMHGDGSLVATAKAAGASSMHAAVIAAMAEQQFDPAAAGGAALAVAADVARWLRETTAIPGLPGDRDLSRDLGIRLRDAELDRRRAGIVGRDAEIAGLAGFARDVWLKPPRALPIFPLEGIGGVGKSTLLAQFVRAALPALPGSIAAPLVAWIDYDRFQIRGDDVRTVAVELTRQFGIAEPAWTVPMAAARAVLRGGFRTASTTPADDSRVAVPDSFDDTAQAAMADTIIEKLQGPGRQLDDRPVLVVLDTVEQLDNIRGRDGELLFLFDSLRQRALPRLLIVASGRRVFSRGYGATAVHLPGEAQRRPLMGLSPTAARVMLTERERMAPADADTLLAAFADLSEGEFRIRIGVPMVLSLLARYIRSGKITLDAGDIGRLREAVDAEAAAAYLYFRVLEQLPPSLRRLAYAGIALREVSAAMLAEVVWPAIRKKSEPATLSAADAEAFFDKLVGETWLIEVVANSDPQRITHRADLRRVLLQKFYAVPRSADAVIARRINVAARAWHRAALARLAPGTTAASAETRFHRLGIVYYSLALGVFNGRPTGLKIADVKAIADDREALVADFPEEHRPMVDALFGGGATPAQLGALAERLRTPIIKEMLSGFIARRQYRDGMAFALGLDPRDRARSRPIARAIVRCFLYSGQWVSGAAAVAPLVAGRHAAAIDAGRSRPYLLPLLAASIIGSDATEILADRPAALAPTVTDWYDAAAAMFGLLEGRRGRVGVEPALARVVAGLPPQRPIEDRLRFVRVLGCLQRARLAPDAADDPDFVMAWRRGGHPLRLPLTPGGRGDGAVSAAQLVEMARDADIAAERGDAPAPAACVAVVETLTVALPSALAGAGLDSGQIYQLVAPLWKQWPVKPFDLRPQTFADACTPSRRRERFRTLCAFAERTDRVEALLDAVDGLALADPDLAAVVAVSRRWRAAFIDAQRSDAGAA